jgi:hypothetical protein
MVFAGNTVFVEVPFVIVAIEGNRCGHKVK